MLNDTRLSISVRIMSPNTRTADIMAGEQLIFLPATMSKKTDSSNKMDLLPIFYHESYLIENVHHGVIDINRAITVHNTHKTK